MSPQMDGQYRAQPHAQKGKLGPKRGVPQSARNVNAILCNAAHGGSIDCLLDTAIGMQHRMTFVNLSTAMHKLARIVKENNGSIRMGDGRFAALHSRLVGELELQIKMASAGSGSEVFPRCWSTIAWVYATLQVQDLDVGYVFSSIAQLAAPNLNTFKSFEFTNMLWAFAKAQVMNPALFDAACCHIVKNLDQFSRLDVSLIVWTLVTAHCYHFSMLRKLTEQFTRQMGREKVTTVSIANLMWGLATASVHPKLTVFQHIGNETIEIVHEFKSQELSITAWAFSRLGVRHDDLFAAICQRLCQDRQFREQIHSQGMANFLWAINRQKELGTTPGLIGTYWCAMHALIPHCHRALSQFKLQEYCCILQAFQKFGLRWGACEDTDNFFVAAAKLGLPLTCHPRPSRFVDLLEIFVVFLGDAGDAPAACREFVIGLTRVCVARFHELEPNEVARFSKHATSRQVPAEVRRELPRGVIASCEEPAAGPGRFPKDCSDQPYHAAGAGFGLKSRDKQSLQSSMDEEWAKAPRGSRFSNRP